jgi:DNA-binding IclR family transcriptional regulator
VGLEPHFRKILGVFGQQDTITASEVAKELGLPERMARNLVQEWVKQGWLETSDPSRRKRTYELSAIYRQFIGNETEKTAHTNVGYGK